MSPAPQHLVANWLLAEGPLPEQARRIWVQVSLVPGQFLACLEVGPQGRGRAAFYGQGLSPATAMGAALAKEAAEPRGELPPKPEDSCRGTLRALVRALSKVEGSQPWGEEYGLAAAVLVRLSIADEDAQKPTNQRNAR